MLRATVHGAAAGQPHVISAENQPCRRCQPGMWACRAQPDACAILDRYLQHTGMAATTGIQSYICAEFDISLSTTAVECKLSNRVGLTMSLEMMACY